MESNFETWEKIRKEYETTKTSYAKLSKKYGFHEKTIQKRSKNGGWVKFTKGIRKAVKKGRTIFLKNTSMGIEELMKKEDETLAKFQEVVDGKVPYEKIFRSIEGLKGDLKIKIDGTVKGLVETTMLIGDKRRELRGALPLKDQEIIDLKKEEFEHKKNVDREKLRIEDEKNETKLLELEIKNLELFANEEEGVNDGLVEVIGGTAKEVWGGNNAEKT